MSASLPQLERRSSPDRAAFVAQALEEARVERALAIVRVPAPRASLDTPLRVLRRSTSIAWRPPEGTPIAGVGRAAELVLEGPDRFVALKRASEALFARMLRRTHPDVPELSPRLFGGWSFAEGGAELAPWDGFGDGRFVLPRWSYEHTAAGGAALTLALDLADGWPGRIGLARAELAALLEALSAPPREEPEPPRVTRVDRPSREAHDALVRGITRAVQEGELVKAVAARRVEVRTERDLDAWAILRRLSARYPTTSCFGMRFAPASTGPSSSFVGATPERLFEKRGRAVHTEALAGSIAAGAEDAERALVESAKDRREHRPVVDHILERLAPLCESIEPAPEPLVRRLPNVLHLHTPIRGVLRPHVHAGELAAALHPTPAVGGFPLAAAAAHIAAHEPHPRGWYAGPVGWLDADGDAELVVALRSGVVRGASAWLYAGGGIVEGSTPEAEWDATELKLRPLLEALGAEGL